MTGTAINVLAVLVGGGVGTIVGSRLPEGMRRTAMQAIGIVTLLIGIQNFLEFDNPLVPLVSVILGLVIGEAIAIDGALKRLGGYLEKRLSKGESPVSRAFVTTSLLFCVGPLTVLGSLEDGLTGDYSLLALKSALDLVAALSFASVLGWGVLLSAGTVLVVQGTLTLYHDEHCTAGTTYPAGSAFPTHPEEVHLARNEGSQELIVFATYFAPRTTPALPVRVDQPLPAAGCPQ